MNHVISARFDGFAVRQPYNELIIRGAKQWENRTYPHGLVKIGSLARIPEDQLPCIPRCRHCWDESIVVCPSQFHELKPPSVSRALVLAMVSDENDDDSLPSTGKLYGY